MKNRPRVALLIESSRAYGRGLLAGIAQYVRDHHAWSIYVEPHGLAEPPPDWLENWNGDGILARVTTPQMARMIRDTGIPAIDLRGATEGTNLPLVGLDSPAAARLAFEHLRERGFRHFGYCGLESGLYRFLDQRAQAFIHLVEAAGFSCHCFPDHHEAATGQAVSKLSWDDRQQLLSEWVAKLPQPIGLFACHDTQGVELLNACRQCHIDVPDSIAVVGVDNDDVVCGLSDPPLSSVDSNTHEIGYRAASLLDQMMSGDITLTGTTLIPPLGVVARRSTETLAIDDQQIAAVMRFIRNHACDGINVDDVVQNTSLSRSTLDRRFARYFGHSPSDEILRLRIERVKQLLIETTWSLPQIAHRSGFVHPEHMGVLFRRKVGQTPGEFRRTHSVSS